MDPSIMKLLEEDEDESMHSGADVEAFTAALNRDIEGGSSSSQHVNNEISFSQDNNQTSSQMYSPWQPPSQDENSGNQSHQQGLGSQDQQSSEVEMKEHGSSMEIQQDNSGSQEPSVPQSQLHRPVQVEGQGHSVETISGEFSQPQMSGTIQPQMSGTSHAQMPGTTHAHMSGTSHAQMSGTSHAQVHEPSRMLTSSNESQFSNSQKTNSQSVSTPEQTGTPANRAKQIPFGSLLPIIIPELDKDKSMQLQTLYGKLRRNEIPKEAFVRVMRSIVGDQMLRLAVVKMQAKSQSSSQQPHLRPTGTTAQFSDPYSFGQLHQKSHNNTTMTRNPAPVNQMVDNNSLKSKDMEYHTDSHGVQTNKIPDRSAITIQGLSKQQQQHLHFSQSSFPMYGANSYFTSSNVTTPSTLAKPQSLDPQTRPGQIHQGFGSAHGDGSSQAMNVMNTPKIERQNSYGEPKRMPGVTMTTVSTPMQHTPVPWQISKEQKFGTSQNLSFVKQEPSEQAVDKQPKPHISSSQGPTFSGTVLVDQGESRPVPGSDELLERHNSGAAFPSSLRTPPVAASASVPMDTEFQVGAQNICASSMAVGSNSKASAKKSSSGQKKPLDALASSPPLPSKKQKVAGAFADQSIEQLNDVTAVSGVNLREEEEQLFSGPKDESRVSEASRKAVQEEEDRLLLQKVPLQKKLAEIMTKCGLKNLSNDVERCLSLCVEERLRGLISSLIRVSKQRVDSEKSRHNIIVTSDVREQILAINRKAREEWDKKQAEAEKIRKQNEPDSSGIVDVDKEKDEGRAKSLKMPVNKEEDDKMRTTAANVAARAAVGGDDMLSKWQLMAQARQKRDVGPETTTSSQAGNKEAADKQLTTPVGNSKETQGTGKGDLSATPGSGMTRQGGISQVPEPPPRAAPRISVKDVIAVLEREPQMAKSTIIYRLYDKMHAEPAAE